MPAHDQLETLWKHVTGHLRSSVSPDAYARWFSSLKLKAAGDDAVRLLVPDSIHQLWIEVNYLSALQSAFGAITGMKHVFEFERNDRERRKNARVIGGGKSGQQTIWIAARRRSGC